MKTLPRMKVVGRAILCFALSGSLLALTACVPPSPHLARLVDGEVAFMVCGEMEVNSIVVSTIDADLPGADALVDVWELTSLGTLIEDGTVIVLGDVPQEFRETIPLTDGVEAQLHDYVSFYIAETRGNSTWTRFEVENLSADFWLDSTGQSRSESC